MEPRPQLSVVITVDYRAGDSPAWDVLREVLRALATQADRAKAEYIFVESESLRDALPNELRTMLPELRVVFSAAETAGALKNVGFAESRADLVAMLDADCVPSSTWLRAGLDAACDHPDATAINGRTVYPGDALSMRALALLNRSYVEGDERGRTEHLSVNNAIFRRRALEVAPFPDAGGTHSSRLQSEALRRSGAVFAFAPEMRVTHDHRGWATEREIRTDLGYSVVRVRVEDPEVPHRWMTRLGVFSMPAIFSARVGHSWWLCLKHGRKYGVAAHELPVALAMALVCCGLELPGVWRALRDKRRGGTAFR